MDIRGIPRAVLFLLRIVFLIVSYLYFYQTQYDILASTECSEQIFKQHQNSLILLQEKKFHCDKSYYLYYKPSILYSGGFIVRNGTNLKQLDTTKCTEFSEFEYESIQKYLTDIENYIHARFQYWFIFIILLLMDFVIVLQLWKRESREGNARLVAIFMELIFAPFILYFGIVDSNSSCVKFTMPYLFLFLIRIYKVASYLTTLTVILIAALSIMIVYTNNRTDQFAILLQIFLNRVKALISFFFAFYCFSIYFSLFFGPLFFTIMQFAVSLCIIADVFVAYENDSTESV
jgi:hypothetical protein